MKPLSVNHGWLASMLLVLILSMTACGFHLREYAPVLFKTVELKGKTRINTLLKHDLEVQHIQVSDNNADAEAHLELMNEERLKRILSLGGTGLVREFELYYRVTYRTRLASEKVWSPPLTMEARRDFTYDDANLLAKQEEEENLRAVMEVEVKNGILRRLSALKKAE